MRISRVQGVVAAVVLTTVGASAAIAFTADDEEARPLAVSALPGGPAERTPTVDRVDEPEPDPTATTPEPAPGTTDDAGDAPAPVAPTTGDVGRPARSPSSSRRASPRPSAPKPSARPTAAPTSPTPTSPAPTSSAPPKNLLDVLLGQ